jgi:DNA-directed RNA polymerase specialized sigma24 family protein
MQEERNKKLIERNKKLLAENMALRDLLVVSLRAEGETYQKIGDLLDVTRETVRQRFAKVFRAIKKGQIRI